MLWYGVSWQQVNTSHMSTPVEQKIRGIRVILLTTSMRTDFRLTKAPDVGFDGVGRLKYFRRCPAHGKLGARARLIDIIEQEACHAKVCHFHLWAEEKVLKRGIFIFLTSGCLHNKLFHSQTLLVMKTSSEQRAFVPKLKVFSSNSRSQNSDVLSRPY